MNDQSQELPHARQETHEQEAKEPTLPNQEVVAIDDSFKNFEERLNRKKATYSLALQDIKKWMEEWNNIYFTTQYQAT